MRQSAGGDLAVGYGDDVGWMVCCIFVEYDVDVHKRDLLLSVWPAGLVAGATGDGDVWLMNDRYTIEF